jgi:hypothetical protein
MAAENARPEFSEIVNLLTNNSKRKRKVESRKKKNEKKRNIPVSDSDSDNDNIINFIAAAMHDQDD